MKIGKGVTRVVFIFDKFVIKVPNFTYCQLHFMKGFVANLAENVYCKVFKKPNYLANSIYCAPFGLFLIQEKAEPLGRDLTEEEVTFFKEVTSDIKEENFGIINNKVVCLDYAR